jgi:uncharacterized membrane protein YebE (DUF533 family)
METRQRLETVGKEKPKYNNRVSMLETMVAIAKADGNLQDCERERILSLMEKLRLDSSDREHVKNLLEECTEVTLPSFQQLPSYDFRRYLFQQALLVAYEDGVIHRGETEALENLARRLHILPEHVNLAWKMAKDLMER